jgi:hypothetical protein
MSERPDHAYKCSAARYTSQLQALLSEFLKNQLRKITNPAIRAPSNPFSTAKSLTPLIALNQEREEARQFAGPFAFKPNPKVT